MTERILNRKNLISFGLFAVAFHAVITFFPYFFDHLDWMFIADYILLGLTGFAAVWYIAKEQYPIRFQPAQMLLILFLAWYIISCLSMTITFGSDWVTYNSEGLLNTAVSGLLVFPLGYVMVREGKNSFGRTLLHIVLLGWTLFIAYVLFYIFQGQTITTFNYGLIQIKDKALQLNCNQNTTGAWEMLFFLVCCFMTLWCKKTPLKIVYGLASVIHFVGLTLSNCRAGFLASLAGVMAIAGIAVYLWLDRKKSPHKLLVALIAAVAAGAAYYFLSQAVFSIYNGLIKGAKSSNRAFAEQEQTFSGREQVWGYAVEGIFSSFRTAVFGVTPMSVVEMINQVSTGEKGVYTHNQFLEIAAGIGIPGLCIFLGWFGLIVRDAYKLFFVQKDRTLFLIVPVIIMALMLANMMEATLEFYDFINHYAFFLLCGLLYGKVNEPIRVKTLSRQEIRNKERKKKKK